MKDAEDEAFDELAKRQGHWGGGFQAKRKMAAGKLPEFCTCHETRPMECQGCEANRLAHPAQEPVACARCKDLEEQAYDLLGQLKVANLKWSVAHPQPAQEPVAYVMGTHGGRFVVAPLNPSMVLPVGMALYARPA